MPTAAESLHENPDRTDKAPFASEAVLNASSRPWAERRWPTTTRMFTVPVSGAGKPPLPSRHAMPERPKVACTSATTPSASPRERTYDARRSADVRNVGVPGGSPASRARDSA